MMPKLLVSATERMDLSFAEIREVFAGCKIKVLLWNVKFKISISHPGGDIGQPMDTLE